MLAQNEGTVINYLLGKDEPYRNKTLLLTLCDLFAPNINKLAKNKVCPFCGRKFRTYGDLCVHLTKSYKSPCYLKFMGLVKYIVDSYITLKKNMYRCHVDKLLGWCIDLRNGNVLKFRNYSDLIEFIRVNPRIMEVAVNGSNGGS